MKTHTEFNPSKQFALALIGEPFTRKTSTAMQFPDPLFFDCDRKLASVVSHYPGKRFWYVEPSLDANGNELPDTAKWLSLCDAVAKWAKAPGPKVNVVDSMSIAADWLRMWLPTLTSSVKPVTIGGEPYMNQSMWWPFKDRLQKLVAILRSAGKPCIFVFHEKTEKDEATGTIGKKPALSGELGDTIAKLFTDVWRTSIKLQTDAKHPDGIAYVVRTVPMPQMQQLGHTRPLPSEFEFDWSIVGKAYADIFQPEVV